MDVVTIILVWTVISLAVAWRVLIAEERVTRAINDIFSLVLAAYVAVLITPLVILGWLVIFIVKGISKWVIKK